MSYQSQWTLTYDDAFVSRCRACEYQQAAIQFGGDPDARLAALADAVLRGDAAILGSFQSVLGAAPGLADEVDTGDGTIDSSLVVDAEILAGVQGAWPTVAELYFDEAGAPI
jgi:hypothetical protein